MTTTRLTIEERTFEDVSAGHLIGPVTYGPMTIMHLVRWCAAMENWHRIHYDYAFCTQHEGLPGPLINGSWKQQVIAQFFKDWAGPAGWVQSLTYQFRGMDMVGEMLRLDGRVLATQIRGELGEVRCTVEMRNSSGQITTTGEATVVLPLRGGPQVAYPASLAGEGRPAPTAGRRGGICPPEFEQYIGLESDPIVSPEAIDASSVRRFMQAIMVRDEDCYDIAGRGASRYGSLVASPLYPLHALHVPASADDSLAQAEDNDDFDGASQTAWSSFGLPELAGAPKRILNAGNEVELYAYAPVGARIEVTSRYDDIYGKAGKHGPLLFVSVLSRYSVHETGQPLLLSRQTTILR